MARDSPPNVCPSRAGEVNPELLPHRVHPTLGRLVHDDPVGPLAGEPLLLPLAGRVDSHLRAEREPTARVIQHVDRAHREPHVAFGIDMVQRHPPRLLRVLHVHAPLHHTSHFAPPHQPLPPPPSPPLPP